MPKLSRWFIKSSLVYFVLAVACSVLLATQRGFTVMLQPAYFHLFMVGWITQMIIGVSFWFFPRYTRERPRGHEKPGWLAFWLLNIGLPLRAIFEPWSAAHPGEPSWGLALSAVLQWGAGMAYVVMIWGRVKGK